MFIPEKKKKKKTHTHTHTHTTFQPLIQIAWTWYISKKLYLWMY
jgi:hypothetical protein